MGWWWLSMRQFEDSYHGQTNGVPYRIRISLWFLCERNREYMDDIDVVVVSPDITQNRFDEQIWFLSKTVL